MKLNRMSSIAAIVSLSIIFMAAVARRADRPQPQTHRPRTMRLAAAPGGPCAISCRPLDEGQADGSEEFEKAAAAQFNDFLADLGRAVADDPGRPHYLDSSFFRRFENPR